ncbi:MAG: SDR family NAD(P)-dependent oxidoreductase [Desulfobacterales bacterium]
MKLEGKVALVTGASKGIGESISRRYAAEGAKVALASRSTDLLSKIAQDIKKQGGEATALPLDVTKSESVDEAVSKTVSEYGRIDIMVNNAGIAMTQPSISLSNEDWQRTLETDLFGVFYGCRAAGREMIKMGGGCIINITSMWGIAASPLRAAYCVSKAGGNMLTKVLAAEWAGENVRVNAIAPGYIRTEMVQNVIDKGMIDLDFIERRTPRGRIGEVGELLGVAVYLASDEASFTTGSVFTVDGGWTANGYGC